MRSDLCFLFIEYLNRILNIHHATGNSNYFFIFKNPRTTSFDRISFTLVCIIIVTIRELNN